MLAGMFALFACLGLGRFALGMLLPSMADTLALSYTQMGLISTGNFVGYLLAVLVCGRLIRRCGERWSIVIGLLMVGLGMLLVSYSSYFIVITVLYLMTGIGTGIANVTVMSLVAHYSPARAGYLRRLIFAPAMASAEENWIIVSKWDKVTPKKGR